MDKAKQVEFVNELIAGVVVEIHAAMSRVPESWDGHELRKWIADRFAAAYFIPLDRKRLKSYKNDLVVHNL